MIIAAPTASTRQPHYYEGSGLRSKRDSDAVSRGWIKQRTSLHRENSSNSQQFFALQKQSRQRRRIVGGGGSTSGAGMQWKGEYNGGSYAVQSVVTFTPDGQSAGNYVAIKAVPAGVSPDTGFPYWQSFSVPAPGIWGP